MDPPSPISQQPTTIAMSNPTALDIFNREFLTIRCRLIDLAAAIDRVGRANG